MTFYSDFVFYFKKKKKKAPPPPPTEHAPLLGVQFLNKRPDCFFKEIYNV